MIIDRCGVFGIYSVILLFKNKTSGGLSEMSAQFFLKSEDGIGIDIILNTIALRQEVDELKRIIFIVVSTKNKTVAMVMLSEYVEFHCVSAFKKCLIHI